MARRPRHPCPQERKDADRIWHLKGCPIAVEVFEGNKKDCQTLSEQIEKVRVRFGISKVIWVGDRGTITDANIVDELKGAVGLEWITALTKPQSSEISRSRKHSIRII